ncbi:hypothetical protein BGZ96_003690 [Linnemannia gamsii]|uniref:Fungal-type protein kinase domain-containing protein n=1 Tax=Linnemannia gamsii TaxID=64522 RepID=A0ABQ7JJ02_9FUNG|nr:hypothetical protein BGZ96_003690 [Linnemannia gamsii]
MEQHENEHVSFTSFVQKFELSDLQDAQDAYEALIDSTRLKTLRRQSLNTTYNTFKKHGLRRFWPNHLLKMERRETKTNFDITAAKTARIVQDASLKETSRAAGLLEDNSNGQDKLEHSVRPKRKMQQGGSFKESRKQARAVGETTTWEIDEEDAATVSSIQGTTPNSDDKQGLAAVPQPHFNPDSTRRVTLTMAGFDVGAAFRRLQEEAAPFINDESLKVSVKKVYMMLSANSIWDTSERLPGMPADTHRGILSEIKPAVVRLSKQFDVAFAEIKVPKDDGRIRLYIQDKWALTSFAKDTIDLHLRERRTITSIYCLQVFGYQLTIYELRFQAGLYMWTEIGTGYLPRDKNDTHCLIRCMELLKTLRTLLDDISVRQYVHTPPRRDPDHFLPEELRPQPTNITPSSRRFFGCVAKASSDKSRSN